MKINSLYTTYYVYKCIADLIKMDIEKRNEKIEWRNCFRGGTCTNQKKKTGGY